MSINRRNIQPETLHQRRVDNRVLYSHVVSVEPRRLIFISGQLARDKDGGIVGIGDMRRQLRQTLENIKAALEAAGATACTTATNFAPSTTRSGKNWNARFGIRRGMRHHEIRRDKKGNL